MLLELFGYQFRGQLTKQLSWPCQVSVKLCETRLHQARLRPLRVSLILEFSLLTDLLTDVYGQKKGMTMVLVRDAVGQILRTARTDQGRTLRDVARDARVSLGYLSEVERGQKEASSELLSAICSALGLTLSGVFSAVSVELKSREGLTLTVVDAA
jgi:DNA-binding XRE family transcriptional regulator